MEVNGYKDMHALLPPWPMPFSYLENPLYFTFSVQVLFKAEINFYLLHGALFENTSSWFVFLPAVNSYSPFVRRTDLLLYACKLIWLDHMKLMILKSFLTNKHFNLMFQPYTQIIVVESLWLWTESLCQIIDLRARFWARHLIVYVSVFLFQKWRYTITNLIGLLERLIS